MRIVQLTFLFFLFPKSKKEYSPCTSQLDCPRHMYCHQFAGSLGFCKNFPYIPLPVPIPPPPRKPSKVGNIEY